MNTLIKTIEDLSLNAWPSHQIELYDGWILRFSYFYTHRTNSVEQIGPSTIPVEEKVQYCEEIYRRWGTPAIFKISPLVNPGFDAMLADRGYVVQHTTHVMTMDLANFVFLSMPAILWGMVISGIVLFIGTKLDKNAPCTNLFRD